ANLPAFFQFADAQNVDYRTFTATIPGELLRSTMENLRAPLLLGSNTGFLRRDASLAIVFITDRDDDSPGDEHSYGGEFSRIHGAPNKNALSFPTVSGGPIGCIGAGGEAAAATRFTNLSLIAPGAYESICSDWPNVLDSLGRAIFNPRTYLLLDRHTPAGL